MKTFIILSLIFSVTVASAQNPFYKKIVETQTDDATILTVPTPALLGWGYYMQFSLHKILLSDNTFQYVLQAGNHTFEEQTRGVTIQIIFRDQDIVTLDDVHYQQEYIETLYAAQCEYVPTVVLPDYVIEKLRTKKISYFRVDGDRAYNLTATSFASRIKRFTNKLVAVQMKAASNEMPTLQINEHLNVIK